VYCIDVWTESWSRVEWITAPAPTTTADWREPIVTPSSYKRVGCFAAEEESESQDFIPLGDVADIVEICGLICWTGMYKLYKASGLLYGHACDCATIELSFDDLTRIDDSNCDIPCRPDSNSNQTCGGKRAVEYYTAVFDAIETDTRATLAATTTVTSSSGAAVTSGASSTNAAEENKESLSGSGALGTSWLITAGSFVAALLLDLE